MKRILKYIGCSLAFMLMGFVQVEAQDPHFTQAHRIPTFYNPASAGLDVEHIRLTMLYRNQWASVTSPFVTQSMFFDKQVSKVGLGATLINNSSGEAGIRQIYLNGMLSYHLSFGEHQISGGLQIGLIQKSFDPSKMTFDDQYTPDQGFNTGNTTSETFSYTKLTRPDFGTGFLWTYGKLHDSRFHPFLGASLQHINQPKETFIEEENFIPRRLVTQGGVGIKVNDQLELTPSFLYQQQQLAKETMFGLIATVPLQDRNHVEGGMYYRNKDAIALYAGYQMNSLMLGVSYDANISGLTGGPGAFELTLTYIPKAKVKKENKPKKKYTDDEEKDIATRSIPSSGGSGRIVSQPPVVKPVENKVKPKTVPEKGSEIPKQIVAKPAPVKVIPKAFPPVVAVPAKETLNKVTSIKPHITEKPLVKPAVKRMSITVLPEIRTDVQKVKSIQPKIAENKPVMNIIKPAKIVVLEKPVVIVEEKQEMSATTRIIVDTDKDGIADILDKCPYHAGSSKNNGCPDTDIDSDNDGIPDKSDACPYIKGTLKTHGCPDTDGDGIANDADPCPYVAGPNGCPDTKPDLKATLNTQFENIEFASASSDVKGIYKLDVIEPALDSVWDNKEYSLVISGHTDGEGDAAFNMVLSQARADEVRSIFIRKGMDESRIITIAYGETMPLRDNISEEGRAHNRRVEVHIIKNNKP